MADTIEGMRKGLPKIIFITLVVFALAAQQRSSGSAERLATHRNLGKAFYENPTTGKEAVAEFQKALALAPGSARERLNLALARLRAGETAPAMAELEAVQKMDPKLPHTWFNLGVQWKRLGETEKALEQMERFVALVPDDAVGHYNLGVLLKQNGANERAIAEFQKAAELDPNIFAPHFQLYNMLRQQGKQEEARKELAAFQRIKKEQEGSAIPEDMDWSFYSEVLDEVEPAPPPGTPVAPVFAFEKAAPPAAGADLNNDGKPDPLPPGVKEAVFLDYDHDYDLDVIALGEKVKLLRNQGEGGWEDRTADLPLAEAAAVAGMTFRAVLETKSMDLILIHPGKGAVLYRDQLAGRYKAEPLAAMPVPQPWDLANRGELDLVSAGGVWRNLTGKFNKVEGLAGLTAADIEGRGLLDLITAEGIRRNQGSFQFAEPKKPAGWPEGVTEAASGDFDRDGKTDLLLRTPSGWVKALNRTPAKSNWLRITLTGVKNLKLAPGSEVEVKAGGLYQKRLYDGTPILFNLRGYAQADVVRITWANGLIQNEVKVAANKAHEFKEAQRLSGSCPMIWTWNGREFEYITDVLGVAPLGAAAGDGQYFPVDHDEFIQIPGEALVARDGHYEVRITEELSEIAYLDQVRLIAVDHPENTGLYTNDKFKAPPFPEFRLFGVQTRVAPLRARDHRGKDVLPRVIKKDRTYADGFARGFDGIAEPSFVELDFGKAAQDGKAVLVMSGWVDWADGSTFLQASQASKAGLIMPYLQVKDEAGQWRTVIEDMGMPAGKPKTIVVNLTGKWLSASREVRIGSSLCLYWDEIFLSPDVEAPRVQMQELAAGEATLQFRGFSKVTVHPQRLQPEHFAYTPVSASSMWNPTPGRYTRFGDVRTLVDEVDDRFVIMGSGDEMRLRFPALPTPKEGWRRDFLLKVDGWAKDRDPNTAYSQTVEPLPFHGMSQYPYSEQERFPAGDWVREFNTRPALRLLRPLASAK